MPFIPAANTAQVRVNQTLNGQKIINVFHCLRNAPIDEASLQTLGDEVIAAWNSHVGPIQTGACQYESVSLRDMTTEDGLGIELGFPPLSGGDRTGPPMPGNVAICARLITNFSGRNRRGRMFIGGLEEDQQDGNHLTDVAAAQVETNLRSFVQQINALADWEVVIASYYDGMALELQPNGELLRKAQPRPNGALLTPVQNVVVDVQLDSMKRRLTGHGD